VSESQPDPLELVEAEALKRLAEDKAFDIPNHVLFKFYSDLNKARDRREKENEETEVGEFSLLDELQTIPATRAKQLLREEIGRLRSELAKHEQALRELEPLHAV
jgi:hypothetical protein